mmetsp:Transcript_35202/g.55009  ORF Transcript_35202/g.55009 Transcript_35202/m.55009 type:complete len:447 (+) Transcript_35202:100-1440(+)
MSGMAGRRLPSGVAGALKSCKLYSNGQQCSTCPNQGLHTCPIRDIEDCLLPHHLLSAGRRIGEARGSIRIEQGHQCAQHHIATPAARSPCAGVGPHHTHGANGGHIRASRMPGFGKATVSTMTAPWGLPHRHEDRKEERTSAPPMDLVKRRAAEQVPQAATALSASSRVTLESEHGQELFREALVEGTAENYFSLAEQAVTETDPAHNAASTMSVVFNALGHDPLKVWKGPWRWNTPDLVQAHSSSGRSAASIRQDGLSTCEFAAMARNCGVNAKVEHAKSASQDGLASFRGHVKKVSADSAVGSHVVINFSPAALGLHGPSTFGTVAGYHAGSDMVLVMDVNRSGSSPFWVHIGKVWDAMAVKDASTGQERGYVLLCNLGAEHGKISDLCPLMVRSWARSRSAASHQARLRQRRGGGRRLTDVFRSHIVSEIRMVLEGTGARISA